MKTKIVAKNEDHLKELIKIEIEKNGLDCDLNHIDVSNVEDMSYMFNHYEFNGDISKWDISKVSNMAAMFFESKFNGDISKWDVSNVKDMSFMFYSSKFNGDISNWNVSNVKNMRGMFNRTSFAGDISNWVPYNVEDMNYIFEGCNSPIPYWAIIEDNETRKNAINNYLLQKKLEISLSTGNQAGKKIKI